MIILERAVDSTGSERGLRGFFNKHRDELSGSIKAGNFLTAWTAVSI
jgi:hypothetical protein